MFWGTKTHGQDTSEKRTAKMKKQEKGGNKENHEGGTKRGTQEKEAGSTDHEKGRNVTAEHHHLKGSFMV
jgi:hypothetical protein